MRIEALKREAAVAADGMLVTHESDQLTPDEREEFWRRVVDFETAGTTDLLTELTRVGIELPNPAAVDDTALHEALWMAIDALGRMNVFLSQTDHLSDRELYTMLYCELLPDEMPALNPNDRSAWHIGILAGGSIEDVTNYLKYYAGESERRAWQDIFPGETMPAHEDPPYDRDRLLPAYEWK